MPRPRIEGLSDLIFGLALSIGAIELVSNYPQTHGQLITALGAFGFSFLILINVWNRYTTIVSLVPVETTAMLRLNMLLLFLVAVEPYLFNLLVIQGTAGSPVGQYVSAYYALDIAGMNFVLAYFTHILTRKEKKLIPGELIHRFKLARDRNVVVATVFLVSAIPVFWAISIIGTPLRVILWILAVPIIWVSETIIR
jgi:uncharacterized membrane protein